MEKLKGYFVVHTEYNRIAAKEILILDGGWIQIINISGKRIVYPKESIDRIEEVRIDVYDSYKYN